MSDKILDRQLSEMESFAVDITRRAGGILLEQFSKPLVVEYKSKGNTNPVTDADRRSEEFLREAILKEYPDHGVLAEEGSQVDSESSGLHLGVGPPGRHRQLPERPSRVRCFGRSAVQG